MDRTSRVVQGSPVIVGESHEMHTVLHRISRLARNTARVLITGETGTGKELVAKAIHYQSDRRTKRFIGLNCSAIPDHLLESMLFGHERGAFTDAVRTVTGFFRDAEGGTLLLDEIGNMPLSLQAKLLRALQEREVVPVGTTKSIPFDVRIIAATHLNLEDLVREGLFRRDLYYRLKVATIHVPALRERQEDIPLLVDHFLEKHRATEVNLLGFTGEAVEALRAYQWPGNVRELENVVESCVALHDTDIIGIHDLPTAFLTEGVLERVRRAELASPSPHPPARTGTSSSPPAPANGPRALDHAPVDMTIPQLRRWYTCMVYRQTWGDSDVTANILGISRKTLCNWFKRWGMPSVKHRAVLLKHKPHAVPVQPASVDATMTMDEVVREHTLAMYRRTDGNVSRTAELLGISTKTLFNWFTAWGMPTVHSRIVLLADASKHA